MCYVLNDERLIHIEEKTKHFKYEFLSSYIPMWNKIICGKGRRRRAIVDTHAGTGKVLLKNRSILGSSGIFLQKTALKQELLEFYFIEKNLQNYHVLRKNIKKMCEVGFFFPPKFKNSTELFQKNGLPYEKKVQMYKSKLKNPNLEQIHIFKGDCVKIIDHVLKEVDGIPTFFFIDPCGKFKWNLIEKIVEKRLLDNHGLIKLDEDRKRIQGTELFINFSWEAILRNMTKKPLRDQFFKEMFGMSFNEVQKEILRIKKEKRKTGKRFQTYNLYVDLYKNKLRKYFDYVIEMSIIGLKSEKNPVYAMIFCSNNEIAKTLYENKEAELNKLKHQFQFIKALSANKKDFTYEKYKSFIEGQKILDDYFDNN